MRYQSHQAKLAQNLVMDPRCMDLTGEQLLVVCIPNQLCQSVAWRARSRTSGSNYLSMGRVAACVKSPFGKLKSRRKQLFGKLKSRRKQLHHCIILTKEILKSPEKTNQFASYILKLPETTICIRHH